MMITVVVVLVGGFLPFSALAQPLGFVPLPREFFIFLAAASYNLFVARGIGQAGFIDWTPLRLMRAFQHLIDLANEFHSSGFSRI